MFRDTYKILKLSFTRERMKKTAFRGMWVWGWEMRGGGRDSARQESWWVEDLRVCILFCFITYIYIRYHIYILSIFYMTYTLHNKKTLEKMKACLQYSTIPLGSHLRITRPPFWPPVHTELVLGSLCSSHTSPLAVPQVREQPLEREWVKTFVAVLHKRNRLKEVFCSGRSLGEGNGYPL